MELTVTTILIAFAGVFLICFMKGAFGGGFSIVGIPLLSFVMDPVTAGGLLAPLFIAMDLYALRYWKPSTWSKPDLALLLPGLVIGIGFGYLLFRVLDHRAVAIVMARDHIDLCRAVACLGLEGEDRPAFAAEGGRRRSRLGRVHHGGAFGRTPAGDVSAAARPQQGSLCRNDQPVLHGRQRDQGGAVAAAGRPTAGVWIDGRLPARHPRRRLAGLAASRRVGPAPDLSGLLRCWW